MTKKRVAALDGLTCCSQTYLVIFLIGSFFYLFFNHALPVTDPVESNYALTAKEMVLSGNWLSPQIYGNFWFDKPVFFYWLTALSFQLFGFSDWAVRLAPALFAAMGLVLMYWFASRITKPAAALTALLIMGTSLEYGILAKLVITDMVFYLFNCAALCFFYLGYIRLDGTKRWYLITYISMGLAVLTKGPAGIVLPGLIMVLFIAGQRNWAELKEILMPGGMFLFAAVALPWYMAMYAVHGTEFINSFFGVHNYLRATVSEHPDVNVSYYYLVVFLLSMLPWSVLAIKSMLAGGRDLKQRSSPLLWFLFWWIGVFLIFYSLMATKYLTYTFPILFPIALLTAVYVEKMLDAGRVKPILYGAGIPLVLLLLAYMMTAYYYLTGWKCTGAISSLALLLLLAVLRSRGQSAAAVFKTICVCQLATYIVLSLFLFPAMAENRSGKEMAGNITALGQRQVGLYRFYSTSAVFYSGIVAVKLEQDGSLASQRSGGLDWSSKYTMPIQEWDNFMAQPGLNAVIVVPDDQKQIFLAEAGKRKLQQVKSENHLHYYLVTD